MLNQLGQEIPAADVRPVRQIMEGEARVLGKTRATLFAAAALIILTAALCVLSTLMGWVFDRRRDFAIMKALGASGRVLNGFFAMEAAALGATGAVLGFIVGIGIAAWIGFVAPAAIAGVDRIDSAAGAAGLGHCRPGPGGTAAAALPAAGGGRSRPGGRSRASGRGSNCATA